MNFCNFASQFKRKQAFSMIKATCKGLLLMGLVATTGLTSCIREEALNAECDIEGVDSVWLRQKLDEGFLVGNPVVKNQAVYFYVNSSADVSALDPRFYLTPGATLSPASGTVLDFTLPQVYTTRSEDGQWSKQYTVSFNKLQPQVSNTFENVRLNSSGKYYEFFEVDSLGTELDYWDSGNGGFLFTGMGRKPEDYPTYSDPDGYKGKCVSLVTRSTGSFGSGVHMPIAAGNLFIGEFAANQAMLQPLKATRFGKQLVNAQPLYLEGYYKYTAGDVFTDENLNVVEGMRDTCDIYAVLYEVEPKNFVALNGNDVLSSERIVSLARIDNPGEPQQWRYFLEPFRPMNGKTFDPARAARNGYAIAVVMTSSRQGAYFRGAVGSHLKVDEIRVIWNTDTNKPAADSEHAPAAE